MPEQLPSEVDALQRSANAFAGDVLAAIERAVDSGELDPAMARDRVVSASKDAGLFRLTQPRELGGEAASALTLVAVRDALASHNPRWMANVFGPRPGVLAGVPEPLRSSHLAPLMDGKKRASFGFTEPTDAAHYTLAVRDGDELVVTGRKSYVTYGATADFINVLADVEEEGRAFIVIDVERPGVVSERLFTTLDGAEHAAYRFEQVRVPVAHLIGQPGEGMAQAMRQIGDTRLAMAAEAVGRARWTINFLTNHLKKMEQAKGRNESMRLRYGQLRIATYAARSAVYRAARCVDAGRNAINEGIAAKVLATETLGEVVDTAIQLTGGAALVTDHPLAVLYREVRSLRVAEGLSDVLCLNIARGALDLDLGTL